MKITTLGILVLLSYLTAGAVNVNSLFSNNAVLQREVEVPIWGTANNNEKISVEFAGQKLNTVAVGGKWLVKLKAMRANSIPQDLIIRGNNIIILKNILIGDVWLCSGQSNMVFEIKKLKPTGNSQTKVEVLSDAKNHPTIRQFLVPRPIDKSVDSVRTEVNGQWTVCDQNSVNEFSAVAYFFAKELNRKLQVPIGILNSSIGGTYGERWVAPSELKSNPELKYILDLYNKSIAELPIRMAKYNKELPEKMEKFRTDSLEAINFKKNVPRKPQPPRLQYEGAPGGFYNYMIQPLINFPIKGTLWYQGEHNAGGQMAIDYRKLLPSLIKSWREGFNLGEFPFIVVQIPGLRNQTPEIRESQLITVKNTPNTGLVVISDVSDTLDVHPGNKQPVGERASLVALALAYNQKIEYSGPVYESMKREKDKIILSFSHIGGGLMSKDGALKNFEIAGDDNKFYPATAEIKGNNVVVSNPKVLNPQNVRMGWRNISICNLYNKDGLPASIFRTDTALIK